VTLIENLRWSTALAHFLRRTTYLCTTSPLRMLSKWPWISRCGDYWQQAELRTDGARRIMMMMMTALEIIRPLWPSVHQHHRQMDRLKMAWVDYSRVCIACLMIMVLSIMCLFLAAGLQPQRWVHCDSTSTWRHGFRLLEHDLGSEFHLHSATFHCWRYGRCCSSSWSLV